MARMKAEEKHKKVKWEEIYKDFVQHNPTLAKRRPHWQPHSYATIYLKFYEEGGMECTYNYDSHRIHVLSGSENLRRLRK